MVSASNCAEHGRRGDMMHTMTSERQRFWIDWIEEDLVDDEEWL